jgi:hypothetical protein
MSLSRAHGLENLAPQKYYEFELEDDVFFLSWGIVDIGTLDFKCATILVTKTSSCAIHTSMVLGWFGGWPFVGHTFFFIVLAKTSRLPYIYHLGLTLLMLRV